MEVVQNQEFLLLPADEVGKLLSSDDLKVLSEVNIFEVGTPQFSRAFRLYNPVMKINFRSNFYRPSCLGWITTLRQGDNIYRIF